MSEWHDIGAVDAVPDGEARAFEVAGERLCVVRHGECFFALADLCTHGHAFLSEGYCDVDEGVIECPLHGGLFDLRTGEPKGAPAEKDAPVYQVKVSDGHLFVQARKE
jgi:nitrite reductase/ring-hydroxylating ferredoxin subunit